MKRYPIIPRIITENTFRNWCEDMILADMDYHIDDDPSDIIHGNTGEPLFTGVQAIRIREFLEKVRTVIDWDRAWEIYWEMLIKHGKVCEDSPEDAKLEVR